MIEISRDGIPTFITTKMKLQLSFYGYTRSEISKLKPQDAIRILDDHGFIKWSDNKNTAHINRSDKPENIKEKYSKDRTKVERSTKPRIRHKIATNTGKIPGFADTKKQQAINEVVRPKTQLKNKNVASRKVHTTVGKFTAKIKSATAPYKLNVGGLMNKFKGMSPLVKWGISIGAMMIMSNVVNSFADRTYGNINSISQSMGMWSRESTYMPEKYSRGYDTIKEHMTHFGSRVKLDKTASMVNITPYTSTRTGMVRTSNSIMNSNISLQMHKNAIKHYRY